MTFMEQVCRECRASIVETIFGWGHLHNPTFRHHPARPARSAAALSSQRQPEGPIAPTRRTDEVPPASSVLQVGGRPRRKA